MADDGGSSVFYIIVIIWLIIITVAIVVFGLYVHRIDLGPTGAIGPTGPSGGPPGPTGPTGPSGGSSALTALQTTFQPVMAMPLTMTTATLTPQAQCFPCQFTNLGQMSDFQPIPSGKPSIVRWLLNNNTLNASYQDGTFVLPAGVYVLSNNTLTTSVVYPSVNSQGSSNNGGTYRTAAVWLRDTHCNNVVYENDLLGVTPVHAIPNQSTTVPFPTTLQIHVFGTRNRLSILTWTDAISQNIEIGTLSRLNLIKIS